MKKVCIVTMYEEMNFGQRLQNLALQHTVESLWPGQIQVDTLKMCSKYSWMGHHDEYGIYARLRLYTYARRKKIAAGECPQGESRAHWLRESNRRLNKKMVAFGRFNKQYIHTCPRPMDRQEMQLFAPNHWSEKYDGFLAGSDQIWNTAMAKSGLAARFLQFAHPEQRFSYAASICQTEEAFELSPERAGALRDIAQNQGAISLREDDGAKMLKKLLGCETRCDVDPALLLSGEEWQSLLKLEKKETEKPYLLFYALRGKPELEVWAKRVAQERGLQFRKMELEDDDYAANPRDFVRLVRDASFVVTNSFHGTVFAFLMHVPFVTEETDRGGMSDRFATLHRVLALPDRNWQAVPEKDLFNMDFARMEPLLEEQRRASKMFLAQLLQKMGGEPLNGDACL